MGTVDTESKDVGNGVGRREGRGFVTSYGEGRRCRSVGCSTTLSRYNGDAECWLHKPDSGSRRT